MNIDTLLYFGSFDPPHFAHKAVMEHAYRLVKPKQVEMVVIARTGTSKVLSDETHRVNLAKKFTGNLNLPVSVNTVDIECKLSGKTIETVLELKKRSPHRKLGLLFGSDQLPSFDSWQRSNDLRALAKCFFVRRSGDKNVHRYIRPGQYLLPAAPVKRGALTSLEIKQHLHYGNSDALEQAMPRDVLDYISSHNLYDKFFQKLPHLLEPEKLDGTNFGG